MALLLMDMNKKKEVGADKPPSVDLPCGADRSHIGLSVFKRLAPARAHRFNVLHTQVLLVLSPIAGRFANIMTRMERGVSGVVATGFPGLLAKVAFVMVGGLSSVREPS